MSFSQTRGNVYDNQTRHVGFMGMGKLGLPCALACASKNHFICGYDPNPEVPNYIKNQELPYREVHSKEYLEKYSHKFVSVGNEDKHLRAMV